MMHQQGKIFNGVHNYTSGVLIKLLITILFTFASGCTSQIIISAGYVKTNIDQCLPEGWKIKSINEKQYPWGFRNRGPDGYLVVIEGKKRKSLITWEESKDQWRSAYRYIKPSYNIWIMPERFHGKAMDCVLQTSYYCDAEFSTYIGSNDNVSIFVNCEQCYYIKSNFTFRKNKLIEKLIKVFQLNRNKYAKIILTKKSQLVYFELFSE